MTDTYVISSVREGDTAVTLEIVTPAGEVKKLRLTVKLWSTLGLSRADVISKEAFEKIKEYSERCEAVTKTLRILSDGMYSIKALTEKLMRSGFSKESAEAGIAVALKRGLIDELSQAEAIASRQASKLYRGRSRVIREISAKGYPSDIAKKAADSVPLSVYETALEISLMKKCHGNIPTEKAELDKLIAAMIRLGFSAGEIIGKINDMT